MTTRSISRLVFVLLSMVMTASGFSQSLNFITSYPNLDSFPVVRLKMTASYNGSLPQPAIQPSDIVVKEDNTTVPITLEECDDSQEAAIVFCVDASTSMRSSAGDLFDISDAFFRCFGSCFKKLRPTSRYALVPFTDVVQGIYPGAGRPGGFYSVADPADSAEFTDYLKKQPYFGPTYVDHAIDSAIKLLQYQPYAQRAIVLVTDDNVLDIDYFDSLMKVFHITFYTMEVGGDNSSLNVKLAHSTGGVYFQASDSGNFEPVMGQLAEIISSEHCILRYVSPNNCPWYASHDINMTLNYKSLSRLSLQSYSFGRNILDKTGPLITATSPSYISRLVEASDNFPCSRGLYYVYDSIRENFILRSRHLSYTHFFPKINGVYKDSSYYSLQDSLVVLDSMQKGRMVYVALDSAHNETIQEFTYEPQPDLNKPVLTLALSSTKNVTIAASEVKAWDRGLKDVRLAASSTNIILDSIRIYNRKIGNAWLHIPDVSKPVHACIEAEDSVGNIGSYCFDRDKPASDTNAPVITQLPVVSPFKIISGTVTEQKTLDQGIKSIVIEPAVNIGTPTLSFTSKAYAGFTVPILDSLQPVRAWISAADSADNAVIDTLRYDPQADDNAPVCTIESPSSTSRLLRVREASAWDRGIASLTVVGALQNLTAGPVVFVNRWEATQTFTMIDPTQPASAVVRAIDSVGQECASTISIAPGAKALLPLQVTSVVDFLTHQSPFDSTATITITNPNEEPVVITAISQSGDVNFTSTLTKPMVFQPLQQQTISIRFTSALLGSWNGQFQVSNDTMVLATIQTKGVTTGVVSLSIDKAQVPYAPMPSSLHLSVSAAPQPINLDTIGFDLIYDGDLLEFSPATIDCSSGNPLCNYKLEMSGANGIFHILLSRNDRNVLATFAGAPAIIELPFITFVSKNASTSVSIAQTTGGQFATVILADTGAVIVGDRCGDPDIRAFLNDRLEAYLGSIIPNPASSSVSLSVISAREKQPATIVIYNQLGVCVLQQPIVLTEGTSHHTIQVNNLSAGNYSIGIQTPNTPSGTTLPLKIVR